MKINIGARASNDGLFFRSILPIQTLTISNLSDLDDIFSSHFKTFLEENIDDFLGDQFNILLFDFKILSNDFSCKE